MVSLIAIIVLGAWAMVATALWLTAERPRHSDPCLHGNGEWEGPTGLKPGGKPLEWHRNGVDWQEAGTPPKLHDCQPQSCYIGYGLTHEDRCNCGASRFGAYGQWENRNSR